MGERCASPPAPHTLATVDYTARGPESMSCPVMTRQQASRPLPGGGGTG